ncbi:hypothetical protein DPMN_085640 [Dreissena polymorpha]|uniref:Uncharacterized protein n=1 Tax=Dreissena polymorpha TaxID=45954 RepID=A0A9D4BD18_DREPO|nr:hypothetical protein DPMN_085640 [Dreissena polymorpha]
MQIKYTLIRQLLSCLHTSDLNENRLADLLWIGTKIFGQEVSPDGLLRYVNQQRAIPADAYVPSKDVEWLSKVCEMNG